VSTEYATRSMALTPGTIDEATRSVEAVLSTENAAIVRSGKGVIEEVLRADGAQFGVQLPLIDGHDTSSSDNVRGSVRDIRVEGNRIAGRVVFAETESGNRAWELVRQGHLTDVSIGYRVNNWEDIPANSARLVSGLEYRTGPRPMRVTTSYTIREVSLVPVGADQAAKFRADETISGVPNMAEETAVEQTAETAVRSEVSSNASATPIQDVTRMAIDADKLRREAVESERSRIAEIRKIAGKDVPEDVVNRSITEGWDTARFTATALEYVRKSHGKPAGEDNRAPAGIVRSKEQDCTRNVLAAALQIRTGNLKLDNVPEAARAEAEQIANQAEQFSGYSLMELVRECARIDKARDPETGSEPFGNDGFIRAAVSGSTLNHVFTTSVNARLLAAYGEAPDTTGWASEEDVANFKVNDIITPGSTPRPKLLPRGGTAEHGQIDDKREQYKVYRYAQQMVISEEDIIDENLGFFQAVPDEMGMAIRMLRPDLVYSLLLANPTLSATGGALFNATATSATGAGHANLATSGTSALSATSLKAAITAMMKQVKYDAAGGSRQLNIAPRFLIIPPDLMFTARELLNSAGIVIAGTAGAVTERGTANTLNGLGITIVVDNRLGATGVTDPFTETAYAGTATNWFLASDPGRTIRVGYRAGTGRAPSVRRFTLDRGQWGIGYDISMDIGVKAIDYKGLYKSAGA
jgi:hypothetical protein